ncbi:phosphatase PAP2 family protein [Lentzea sp. NBRC 105346]|uniref:phosphatase PAP2 family protein n=1 Tax=Lentzea sp. NBRC 105346 TaxID=3032205 RepID=UPI0024A5F2BE|nr:phosphatase PAP2 family protein [Lentzea sp. NBRC 105346]GLZ31660.1 phosphatase PAP2 family protein [Lentzea sp. NBRC 105346]
MSDREAAALVAVQTALATPAVVRAARALSFFGEHSAGWLVLGIAGAALDRQRRPEWTVAATSVFAAHAASVVVKRVVRRRRPHHPDVRVLAGTPSALSFPSSHATSTTTAAVAYGALTNRPLVPMLVPPMVLSRLVLGVHYPTDVLAGAVLGAVIARGVRRLVFGEHE